MVLLLVVQFRLSGSSVLAPLLSQEAPVPTPDLSDRLADLAVVKLPLSPAWEYQAPESIDRPPLYHAGLVILKERFEFRAVAADSGIERWQYQSNYQIFAPYLDNFLTADGVLVFQAYPWPSSLQAIDLETGHQKWETPLGVRGLASDGETKLFIASGNSYQALDALSGRVIWTSDIHPIERGSNPIWYDPSTEALYAWDDNRDLVILDSNSGEMRKKSGLTLYDSSPLMAARGILLFGQGRTSISAVADQGTQPLWTKSYSYWSGGVGFKPIIYGDTLYLRTSEKALLALDPHTGELRWRYPAATDSITSGQLLSNLVFLDGVLYGIFSDARLHGFDAATGREIGYIQFVDVSPAPLDLTVPGLAVSKDMLYISLGKTRLYAFKTVH
jgi:outer membrane protein assembly factor BamB